MASAVLGGQRSMWTIKPFGELTLQELHRIYKERTAVFVVEQDCAYQEGR